MDDSLFLGEQHPESGRTATFEDNGTSAWLYLSETDSPKVIADAWVFNRVKPPKTSELAAYRDGPPPAAEGYAGPEAMCNDPTQHEWALQWSDDGESVAVLQDGMAISFIAKAKGPGYSRSLIKSGPWGQPWKDRVYILLMDQDG